MHCLLLVGANKGFSTQEKNLLRSEILKSKFSDLDLDARVPVAFSLKKDSTGTPLPHILFPAEESGKLFFDRIKRRLSIPAFTTMPWDDLSCFIDKVFDIPGSEFPFAIKVCAVEPDSPHHAYVQRLICFKRTDIPRNVLNTDTRIVFSYPTDSMAAFSSQHDVLLDPLSVELTQDQLYLLYRKFFYKRMELPTALPPSVNPATGNGYLATQQLLARADLRTIFRGKWPANHEPPSLGYCLWQAADHPVFHDILLEGGYFDLYSHHQNADEQLTPFYENGYPVVCMVPAPPLHKEDFLREWRGDFLIPSANQDYSWKKYSEAIRSDMQHCFGQQTLRITSSAGYTPDVTYWTTLQLPPFSPSGRYYYDAIEKFLQQLPATLAQWLAQTVLNGSVESGQIDDKRALAWFCGLLWKMPLCRLRKHESAWTLFLLQLLEDNGVVAPSVYVSETLRDKLVVRPERNEFIYEQSHPPEVLLLLRLLLPPNAYLGCRSSNLLDHPHTLLDHQLILE